MSYRLNLPSADESTVLLTVDRLGDDGRAAGAAAQGPADLRP